MFIKPRRFRMVLAFLLGLAISVVLLIGGYFYYRSNLAQLESEIRAQVTEETVEAFNEEHPMSLVYLFKTDKKAGETIADTDLVPAEVSVRAIPADVVLSPEEALGMVVRCDIAQNTMVTRSLLYTEEEYPDDLRMMEYTVINLSEKLETGSFVDVRIMFPNGLDYIVLTKKRVVDLQYDENGRPSLIRLHMTEEEILRMSSAIVDASLVEGAFLYAVQYVAPDIQKEAVKTYPANLEVLELISNNPNIVDRAVETPEVRNRTIFEQRMDQELVLSGKQAVYGEAGKTGPSPVEIASEQNKAGEAGPSREEIATEQHEDGDASRNDDLNDRL